MVGKRVLCVVGLFGLLRVASCLLFVVYGVVFSCVFVLACACVCLCLVCVIVFLVCSRLRSLSCWCFRV